MQTTLQILQVIVGDCRDTVGVLDHVDGDNFIALHCIALHCIALHCIALPIALHCWYGNEGQVLLCALHSVQRHSLKLVELVSRQDEQRHVHQTKLS